MVHDLRETRSAMPVTPSVRKKLSPPASPGEWPRFLRAQEVDYGDFMTAFATLGILSMLDERDALERAELESEGRAIEGRVQDTWLQAWLDGGIGPLVSWLGAYGNGKQDGPFKHTQVIRSQVRCVTFPVPKHNVLQLAAQILASYDLSQHETFARWFSGEWRELLWELQKKRRYNIGEITLELQELITQSIRFHPHQRILMMASGHSVLLWELMEAVRCLPQTDALGERTTAARHGITVVTASSPTDLLAWATLLACEVDEPDVRIAALNNVQPEPTFDWVITAPPFGVTMPSAQDDLPVPTRRVESAALQNALRFLKPGGHAVALMPRSFSFLSNKDAVQLRRWLLNEWHIDAVLEIPSGKAYEGTAIGTSLLYLRRAAPGPHFLFVGERFLEPRLAGWSDAPNGSHLKAISTVLRRVQGVEEVEDAARLQGMQTTPLSDDFGFGFAAEDAALLDMSGSEGASSDNLHSTFRTSGTGYVKVADLDPEDCQLTYHIADDNLQRGLKALAVKMPGVTIVPLGEVAEIISGMVYESKMTVARREQMPPDTNHEKRIGVLRIGDLSRKTPGFLEVPTPREPQLFLLPEAAQKVRLGAILQNNDVIVSRTGTIGRVNRYVDMSSFFGEESEQSVVASSQLAIVRPKKKEGVASSLFLANLLASPPYQEWIAAQTSGSVISHLKTEILAKVPVPLAPAHVQLSIAEHLIARHPLETLPEVLSEGPQDDSSVLAFLKIREDLALVSKEQSANSWQRLLEAVRSQKPAGRLSEWWTEVTANMQELNDVLALPDERDRFSALHLWQSGFATVRQQLEAKIRSLHFGRIDESVAATNRLVEEKAREVGEELLEAVRSTAHRAIQSLLQAIKIQSMLNPASVPIAKPTILTASIFNLGALSLRDVHARIGSVQAQNPLLTPEDVWDIPVTFTAKHAGSHPLSLEWTAKRMDGKIEAGNIELMVEAVSLLDAAGEGLGTNPYVDGASPVGKNGVMFYGRRDAIHRMDQALARKNRSTVLVIEGNRRIGKSSLLNYYRTKCVDTRRWLPVDINFQDFGGAKGSNKKKLTGIPDVRIFQGMARELIKSASAAGVPLSITGVGEFEPGLTENTRLRILEDLHRFFEVGDPFERFKYVLDAVIGAVAPKRLLLMFDEFDRIQAGIDSGVTSDQMPENFRHLLQSYPHLAAMLTGSLKIRRLRHQYWHVLFNLGLALQLHGLEESDARELVTDPVKGNIVYVPEAVDEIVRITARQPLLIQILCARLFDLCEDQMTRLVTLDMVQEAAGEQVADSENFATIWDFVESPRQRCLLLLIERLTRDGARVTPILLLDEAKEQGISFASLDEFRADVDSLRDMDVIGSDIENQTEYFRIEVPMFSLWLRHHQDFAVQLAAAGESAQYYDQDNA